MKSIIKHTKRKVVRPFFDKDTEDEFRAWCKKNRQFLKEFGEMPEESKMVKFAIAEFWNQRVNKAWGETLELLGKANKILVRKDSELKRTEIAGVLRERIKIYTYRGRENNLAKGRLKGTLSKKKSARLKKK